MQSVHQPYAIRAKPYAKPYKKHSKKSDVHDPNTSPGCQEGHYCTNMTKCSRHASQQKKSISKICLKSKEIYWATPIQFFFENFELGRISTVPYSPHAMRRQEYAQVHITAWQVLWSAHSGLPGRTKHWHKSTSHIHIVPMSVMYTLQ